MELLHPIFLFRKQNVSLLLLILYWGWHLRRYGASSFYSYWNEIFCTIDCCCCLVTQWKFSGGVPGIETFIVREEAWWEQFASWPWHLSDPGASYSTSNNSTARFGLFFIRNLRLFLFDYVLHATFQAAVPLRLFLDKLIWTKWIHCRIYNHWEAFEDQWTSGWDRVIAENVRWKRVIIPTSILYDTHLIHQLQQHRLALTIFLDYFIELVLAFYDMRGLAFVVTTGSPTDTFIYFVRHGF